MGFESVAPTMARMLDGWRQMYTRQFTKKEMEEIQKRKKISICKIEFGNHSSLNSMDIGDLRACGCVCVRERDILWLHNATHIRKFVAVTNIS